MYEFLTDLDEYFCEKYANYDKLCILPGYKMPVMQATRLDDFGRTYAYTLPSENMRLALQENKKELLALLKEKLTDTTFSFSFQPIGFFRAFGNRFRKYGFCKIFRAIIHKYGSDEKALFEQLNVPEEVWKKICKGKFLPTKNLVLSIALVLHLSMSDAETLLNLCEGCFDYTLPKDVVVSYLLNNRVYNEGMIAAALAEYKIINLFIK